MKWSEPRLVSSENIDTQPIARADVVDTAPANGSGAIPGRCAGRPRGRSDFLEPWEVQRIVGLPDRRTRDGMRDHAVLVLLANTPLRKGEVVSLRRRNLVEQGEQRAIEYNVLKKRRKKTGQTEQRTIVNRVPIVQEVSAAIAKYHHAEFGAASDNMDAPLFMTLGKHGRCRKGPITAKAVDFIIKKYARLSGIQKRITAHSFRASYATMALGNGTDLQTVCELLGHASVLSTQPYLRSNLERKQKAAEGFKFV